MIKNLGILADNNKQLSARNNQTTSQNDKKKLFDICRMKAEWRKPVYAVLLIIAISFVVMYKFGMDEVKVTGSVVKKMDSVTGMATNKLPGLTQRD